MSFNVAMLKAMRAEGLDFDAAIRVLEAGEGKSDPTNAERQTRYRANKAVRKSNGVTVTRYAPPIEEDHTPPSNPSVIVNTITPPAVDDLKPEHVVEAWNDLANRYGFSKARLTPERQRKLKTRIRQCSVDEFTEAIAAFDRSSFLRGENDRGWKPNLDWLLEPKNFVKVQEGAYDR